jgi:hypothetical protein
MFALLSYSCGQKTTGKKGQSDIAPTIIKVDDFNLPEQVSINDYFKSIELIPLETNTDLLIGRFKKILFHEGKYFILDQQQHIVFVFDEQGKFIFKIAKKGQGPDEYSFLTDISINSSGNLELLCAMKGFIYEYDLLGNFIKKTHVSSDYLPTMHGLISLDEDTRVFNSMFHPFKIIYFDIKDKKILHEDFEEDSSLGIIGSQNVFYKYNNDYYYYRSICRDVYKVGKNELELAYTWDLGQYNRNHKDIHLSEKAQKDPTQFFKECEEQILYQFSHIAENDRYLMAFVVNMTTHKALNLIYDKSSKECRDIEKFSEGVSPIQPEIVTNEYVLGLLPPSAIKQLLNESILDEANKKIYNELNSDGNPVIVKYYFK